MPFGLKVQFGPGFVLANANFDPNNVFRLTTNVCFKFWQNLLQDSEENSPGKEKTVQSDVEANFLCDLTQGRTRQDSDALS